jgi:hypothetical protein
MKKTLYRRGSVAWTKSKGATKGMMMMKIMAETEVTQGGEIFLAQCRTGLTTDVGALSNLKIMAGTIIATGTSPSPPVDGGFLGLPPPPTVQW